MRHKIAAIDLKVIEYIEWRINGEKDKRPTDGIEGQVRTMTIEQKKHIDAFKYWVQTNTENGVSTIPKSICDNVIRILDGEDGGADGGD